MRYPTAAPRLALCKIGAAFGAVTAASLALAAGAGAQVFTAFANPTGSQLSLATAISNANTAGGNNTIVLTQGRYLPATGMTINGNLTITGDHSTQSGSGAGAYELDGSTQQTQTPAAPFITIASTANVTFEGIQVQTAGPTGNDAVRLNGKLTTYGTSFTSENGIPLDVAPGATLTMTDSLIDGQTHTAGIVNSGAVTLNNVTMANGQGNGIENTSPGTFVLNNTLLAFQVGVECVGGTASPGTVGNANDGSLSDDASCNVQYNSDTTVDTGFPPASANGGPTATDATTFASTVGKGNPVLCPVVDQRFFPNPVSGSTTTCDIGSYKSGATQETAAQGPKCGAPTTFYPAGYPNLTAAQYAANPATQTVPVTSSTSGFGPEAGSPLDIVNGADSASGVVNTTNTAPGGISNGSVALLSPFATPQKGTENVQATKATEGTRTAWSFTTTDWAGLSAYCN